MDRFWYFILPLLILILIEARWPRRARELSRWARWPSALLLLGSGLILMRLIVPAGLVGLSLWAADEQIGLFHRVDVPFGAVAVIGYVLFDLAVWAQHVALHRINVLWRFHRVHHADPDIDVFTALRFHPGEMLLSLLWKGAVVVLLGVPAIWVFWYEVVLNVGAMFNHANMKLPPRLDAVLRRFIVTPDMHRVHHANDPVEANRNFGFFLPWWDYLFGLYQAQPKRGHDKMQIGQSHWRSKSDQSVWALLIQPREKP